MHIYINIYECALPVHVCAEHVLLSKCKDCSASTAATQASTHTGMLTLLTDSRTAVTRSNNAAVDAEFAGITLRPGGTRNIMREHRPLANDAGHEHCVAWWTRGGCFPNCGWRATHISFASAGERTRLRASYVHTHLQAPDSS